MILTKKDGTVIKGDNSKKKQNIKGLSFIKNILEYSLDTSLSEHTTGTLKYNPYASSLLTGGALAIFEIINSNLCGFIGVMNIKNYASTGSGNYDEDNLNVSIELMITLNILSIITSAFKTAVMRLKRKLVKRGKN